MSKITLLCRALSLKLSPVHDYAAIHLDQREINHLQSHIDALRFDRVMDQTVRSRTITVEDIQFINKPALDRALRNTPLAARVESPFDAFGLRDVAEGPVALPFQLIIAPDSVLDVQDPHAEVFPEHIIFRAELDRSMLATTEVTISALRAAEARLLEFA